MPTVSDTEKYVKEKFSSPEFKITFETLHGMFAEYVPVERQSALIMSYPQRQSTLGP